MKPLPFPVRLAAGIAATAAERAKDLPRDVAGLPITLVSQALQASMRVQQQVTDLVIKGDEVLAAVRPQEETPEWARFDEDAGDQHAVDREPSPNGQSKFDQVSEQNEQASGWFNPRYGAPTWLPDYDALTLDELDDRLGALKADQLAELLVHERSGRNRPEYTDLLTRRITDAGRPRTAE